MKVAGFTIIKNAVVNDFPIVEAIKSILPIVDEMIVLIGDSTDDTIALIEAIGDPKIKIHHSICNKNLRKGGAVLAEETDLTLDGKRQSHYEMYLEAMEACGANTTGVLSFLSEVHSLQNIFVAIKQSSLHPNVKSFLDFTFRVIEEGKPHEIAAAFTFGREDLIPSMFTAILKNFQANFPETDLKKLIYYFERHIELDADEHGPMAMGMITELCGNDTKKWSEVEQISIAALEKRIGLWDAIEEQLSLTMEIA